MSEAKIDLSFRLAPEVADTQHARTLTAYLEGVVRRRTDARWVTGTYRAPVLTIRFTLRQADVLVALDQYPLRCAKALAESTTASFPGVTVFACRITE